MIEHDLNDWYLWLAQWEPEMRGTTGRWCQACDNRRFTDPAGIRETDPHDVVHEFIRRMNVLTSELIEDLMDAAHDGTAHRGEASRECTLHAVSSIVDELVEHSIQIRRVLDFYVVPKVDMFVERAWSALDVREAGERDG